MKTFSRSALINNFVAASLALSLFVVSSMITLASPGMTGQLTVNGEAVTLNGETASSGRTVFADSTITTPANSGAVINLGKAGIIELAPNSTLKLNFSENSISGMLTAGQVKVSSAAGVSAKIKTADGEVTSEFAENAAFAVDVNNGATNATAEIGSVFLNNGKTIAKVGGKQTQSGTSSSSALIPALVLAGIIGVSLVYVATRDDDELGVVSPVR